MTGGLDAQGNLVGLHMRISSQSILSYVFPTALQNGRDPVQFQGLNAGGNDSHIGYSFPNLLIDHAMRNTHVPPHFWRGVNHNQNAIYLECFLDELAHAARQDPLAFRRKLMGNHPRHLAVLNAVAEKIGWDKPAPAGVHRGIAQQMGFGSYVAAAAEVSAAAKHAAEQHLTAPPVARFLLDWYDPEVCGNVLQPGTHACSHPLCGRVETRRHEFRRCSCCGRVRYCSRSCQSLDWRLQHKFACLPLLELYGWIESDTESQDTTNQAFGDEAELALASGASSNDLTADLPVEAQAAR